MTATVRLPRILTLSTAVATRVEVTGSTLAEALESLFAQAPVLRGHILEEDGSIRPHVLVFVDSQRAGMESSVGPGSEIQVLQAVSGG